MGQLLECTNPRPRTWVWVVVAKLAFYSIWVIVMLEFLIISITISDGTDSCCALYNTYSCLSTFSRRMQEAGSYKIITFPSLPVQPEAS